VLGGQLEGATKFPRDQDSQAKHVVGIDMLRIFAALLVVVCHFTFWDF
jgi:peptidoglycan/LPS O-acetylase OafA/YrhL